MHGIVVRVQGLVYKDRPEGGLSLQKSEFARSPEEGRYIAGGKDFGIARIRPTAIIGASAKRSSFSELVLQALVKVALASALAFLSTLLCLWTAPSSDAVRR